MKRVLSELVIVTILGALLGLCAWAFPFPHVSAQSATWVDPCAVLQHTQLAIDQATDTKIVAGTTGQTIYICSLVIWAGATLEVVDLVEGTGTVCATGIVGLLGSTTDANGLAFAAKTGITIGDGAGTVVSGISSGQDLCLRQSGTAQMSGGLTYVKR